ncbi:hypothetical protein [Lysinibacillus sp. 3P01SB]|uniref:hypothetical protein n=1 Tax=Lysinibacillus sp. 3P01SB TaxID=3132284 RepID=UPI0039A4973B
MMARPLVLFMRMIFRMLYKTSLTVIMFGGLHLRSKKYYLAKLSISENIFSSTEKRDTIINKYIPEAILNKDTVIEYEKYNFKITDTKEYKLQDSNYISGNLSRFRKMTATILDGDHTREKTFEDVQAIPVDFLYNIQKEVVAFRTCAEINSDKFIENFKRIVEADTRIGDVKLIPYTAANSIRGFFEEVDVVTQINFNLIKPNNPGEKEYYDFERIIDDNNLRELDINMSNENGIMYKKEGTNEFTDTIESGISLTESAYGTVEVKGYNIIESTVPGKRKDRKQKRKSFRSATSANYPRFFKTKEVETFKILKRVHQEIKNLF